MTQRLRFLAGAVALGLAASAAFAARARASSHSAECGPWQHCLCRSVGCSVGGQLCMTGENITCYQTELTEQ